MRAVHPEVIMRANLPDFPEAGALIRAHVFFAGAILSMMRMGFCDILNDSTTAAAAPLLLKNHLAGVQPPKQVPPKSRKLIASRRVKGSSRCPDLLTRPIPL